MQYRVGSSGPWTDVPQDVTGTTTTITITSLDRGHGSYEVRVRAANAEGDSGWSDPPGAGRTHPLTHIAPMFSSLSQTREIAENTAAGVNVGAAVTATDVNNDTLSYTLGGADAASFDFDGTTGQISTKSGVSYDFETKDSYAVTVTASDGAAQRRRRCRHQRHRRARVARHPRDADGLGSVRQHPQPVGLLDRPAQ